MCLYKPAISYLNSYSFAYCTIYNQLGTMHAFILNIPLFFVLIASPSTQSMQWVDVEVKQRNRPNSTGMSEGN